MKKNHKNRQLIQLIIGFVLLSIQSCTVMYSPSMQNAPLLQEKNEVRATVGISDFQAAYAVTDHVGVMLNGYYNNGSSSFTYDSYDPYGYSTYKEQNSKHIEGGAGMFNKLNDKVLVEAYSGFGFGNTTLKKFEQDSMNAIPSMRNRFSADYMRFFIQPAIGYSLDNFDFAFSTRILLQKYYNINTFGYTPIELYDDKLYQIDQPYFFFLEPALTMRFGYKYVKFQAQAILSYKYNVDRLNYMPLIFNVGIHVDLAKRWNTKKSTPVSMPSLDD